MLVEGEDFELKSDLGVNTMISCWPVKVEENAAGACVNNSDIRARV
jgi:hypothetical protein